MKGARALLAVVVAAGGLACTSSSTERADGPATSAASCPTAELEREEGQVQVTLWRHLGPREAAAFDELVDKFNATHPHVHVTAIEVTPGDQLAQEVLDRDPDERPDIAMIVNDAVVPAIDEQLLVPVQACMEAAGTTLADVLPGALGSAAVDGTQWGVPFGASGHVLVYNRAAFRAAGLDPDRPPTSLDDLLDAARALVASGAARTGVKLTDLVPLLSAAGSSREHPNDSGGMAVASWLARAAAEGLARPLEDGDPENAGFLALGSGDAAMAIESTTTLAEIAGAVHGGQSPGLELGIAAVPTPTGLGAVPQRTDALFLLANASGAQRAASWSFLSWLAEPAQQAELAAKTAFLPVNMTSEAVDVLAQRWRDLPELASAWSVIRSATPVADDLAAPAQQLRESLQRSLGEVLLGRVDPLPAMADADARAAASVAGYAADRSRYARCQFNGDCLFDLDLYAVSADAGAEVALTPDEPFDVAPDWSPDGAHIAFSSKPADDVDVFVVDADGANRTRLTSSKGIDTFPEWSPDGGRLAFVSDRSASFDIYTMVADGSDVRRLTTSPDNDQQPSWSPDGQHLAYLHGVQGASDIWVMDASGGDQHPLTAAPGDEWGPAWSPDGTKLAFVSVREGTPAVFVMNADGSDQHRVVAGRNQIDPAWSPDGRQLVVVNLPFNQLYLAAVDGSSYRQLTTSLSYFGLPSWSPDGRSIVATRRAWAGQ